ncbi:MAG: hypothetical protein ACLUD0_03365 [Eubacterium ramulus]
MKKKIEWKQVLSAAEQFVYSYCTKYQQSIFAEKVGAIGDTIIEKGEKFAEISLEEQCQSIDADISEISKAASGVELKAMLKGWQKVVESHI